ncbi:vWA domain-containing protein [Hugenholtzia roseola]|uniref:vWA domain-containing protein n=1 Tax=Hugenholtzia roseola TaxID=1002 RepID=UPI00047B3996|nr:von Willebrand factor type A domain-containing protein [Hugenholtzia roseola]
MQKPYFSLALLLAIFALFSGCQNGTYSRSEQKAEVAEYQVAPTMAYEEMPAKLAEPKDAVVEMPQENTNEFTQIVDNKFVKVGDEALSTFSIDVDNASYALMRNAIENGILPQKDRIRIEELVNYFEYDYPNPKGEHPFSISTEITDAPWNSKHKLVHIGLQGKQVDYENLAPSNLVFLIDASGSMQDENKLPLLKSSLKLLLDQLSEKDRVAIVVYASAAGEILPSTPASEKDKILSALDNLEAGGSTAGGAGIQLAYKIAKENFIAGGNNRVILCTDGDFNVGVSSAEDLVSLIEQKRDDHIFLTLCGFGMGNYKDRQMEALSNAGNGNYYYIDNVQEAKKVFVRQMRGTLFTIAKDVKVQVEFNPAQVQAYRLIGYENRMLNKEDFNDDKKDAGELGAGHSVTALYEIIPVGVKSEFLPSVDDLKYQKNEKSTYTAAAASDEILNLKLRYKKPKEDTSKLIVQPLLNKSVALSEASENLRFAASVAELGLILRDSPYKAQANYAQVLDLAKNALGKDSQGDRAEFVKLAESCMMLAK